MIIQLGDKVKCKITGFTGIAVARTEFINGCVQYLIAPPVSKEGKLQEEESIDQISLEVINKNKSVAKKKKKNVGGATRKMPKMRGF